MKNTRHHHTEEHEYERASIPTLLNVLSDTATTPDERGDAACALGDRLRCKEIAEFEPHVLQALLNTLDHPVFAVRFEAAIALAEAQHSQATAILLEASTFHTLRLDAIRALGKGGNQEAVDPLLKIMQRILLPWADNLQAAAALCALGNAAGQNYLEEKINARRSAERAAAIHFIGESCHPRAFELLSALFKNLAVRDVAIRALGFVEDPRCIPFLKEALESIEPQAHTDLREDILEALRMHDALPTALAQGTR